MKEVKFLITMLLGGVLASAWWAATFWGHVVPQLWGVAGFTTFVLGVLAIFYIFANWDKNSC